MILFFGEKPLEWRLCLSSRYNCARFYKKRFTVIDASRIPHHGKPTCNLCQANCALVNDQKQYIFLRLVNKSLRLIFVQQTVYSISFSNCVAVDDLK